MTDDRIIKVEIVQGDIEHRVTLEQFREAMLNEIGGVTLTFSKKQFRKQVSAAIDRVIQNIRDGRAANA